MSTEAKYPNWFAEIAQANFEQFLLPEAGKPNLEYLQLGVFTGDASVWLCENVLTHKTSCLTDVDTWAGAHNEPIQQEMDFDDVYNTYKNKVKRFNVIRTRPSNTFEYLTHEISCCEMKPHVYDFIYVDAHHTSASAFLDCELSWPLLKPGGLMAVDDLQWQHPGGNPIHAPKLGIAMFLDRHPDEYELLAENSQLWIKKK